MYNYTTDVLLLDNDPVIRSTLERNLREFFQVISFSDGLSGIAWLAAGNRPGIIITDLEMPYLNGWELLRLKDTSSTLQSTPILVMGGDQNLQAEQEALTLGAELYLPKPFNPEKLSQIVLKYLSHPSKGGKINIF